MTTETPGWHPSRWSRRTLSCRQLRSPDIGKADHPPQDGSILPQVGVGVGVGAAVGGCGYWCGCVTAGVVAVVGVAMDVAVGVAAGVAVSVAVGFLFRACHMKGCPLR